MAILENNYNSQPIKRFFIVFKKKEKLIFIANSNQRLDLHLKSHDTPNASIATILSS